MQYCSQEDLIALGEVLLQDKFTLWDPKHIIKKGRERQIFLFEDCIVFAKETIESGKTKYIYKTRLLVRALEGREREIYIYIYLHLRFNYFSSLFSIYFVICSENKFYILIGYNNRYISLYNLILLVVLVCEWGIPL